MTHNITDEDNPHLSIPTPDGNAHVIPKEVFTKIISGEMKITDMDDWEMIIRTVLSEWLRDLEAKAALKAYGNGNNPMGSWLENFWLRPRRCAPQEEGVQTHG